MRKMHLGARPKNEGARRLAWWVWQECAGSMTVASIALRVPMPTLDRLLSGELVPGEELVRPIAMATGDAITRWDWRFLPEGGWFDQPAVRRAQAA